MSRGLGDVYKRQDQRLGALEAAAVLVEHATLEGLFEGLCGCARQTFDADWAVLLDLEGPAAVSAAGTPPPAPWLAAFLHGASAAVVGTDGGPDDVAWAALPNADQALVVGRQGRPFRARERRQLVALSRIADARRDELAAPAAVTRPATGR